MPVDPSGAVTGSVAASSAALDALIAAELNALAADAEALQAQVAVGDVVQAQVLPPNGLTDLVSILGNRVAAALPPSLTPGDVVTVQVTGFDGPQILMQLVSTDAVPGEPSSGTPAPGGGPPAASSPAAAASSAAAGAPAGPGALAAAAANPLGAQGASARIAPPVAVFVAASVRPSPDIAGKANASPVPPGPGAPPAGRNGDPEVAAIETRLAVARAGVVLGKFAAPAPPARAAAAALPPPVNRGFSAPPPIVVPARFVPAAATSIGASGATGASTGRSETAAPAHPASLDTFTDPAALVRALRLPVTPTNLAAANLALTAPQRLPAALATLERALPQLDDPRVQTLRTIAAFLSKIEPSSPELAGQIAAYVDQAVVGGDAKLAQLFAAQQTVDAAAAPAPVAEPAGGAGSSDPAPQPAAAQAGPTVPVVALAQVVERVAALATDLKTQLQELLAAPPAAAADDDLVPAAATALAAVTGVQLASAQAALASPQQISFALPLWLGNGYTQAQVAVDRDAPGQQRVPLDGDNFHIAFVLDTKNLGTVTVDLVTVGRAFSLTVKTEDQSSAKHFAGALDRLTSRLETLRYIVHSAETAVQQPDAAVPAEPLPDDDDDHARMVNSRA